MRARTVRVCGAENQNVRAPNSLLWKRKRSFLPFLPNPHLPIFLSFIVLRVVVLFCFLFYSSSQLPSLTAATETVPDAITDGYLERNGRFVIAAQLMVRRVRAASTSTLLQPYRPALRSFFLNYLFSLLFAFEKGHPDIFHRSVDLRQRQPRADSSGWAGTSLRGRYHCWGSLNAPKRLRRHPPLIANVSGAS